MRVVRVFIAIVVMALVGVLAAPGAQAANYFRGITWYWLSDPDCGWYDYCYGMKVKASKTSCPEGLFVTLKEYNTDGDIVGTTIDSVDSLYRGETAVLIFPSTADDADEAGVSRIQCFNF